MDSAVGTVIFPVAGLGTRLLPATKSVPKELLPVYDKPLIQFAMDEAYSAGIGRIVFVSHPSRSAIEDYVASKPELAAMLRAKGPASSHVPSPGFPGTRTSGLVFTIQPEPLASGTRFCAPAATCFPGPSP